MLPYLDFWEVFSVGQSLFVLGTDFSSFKPKIVEIDSYDPDTLIVRSINGESIKLGGVQGLNIRNSNMLYNWLEVKNINIEDVKRINIYE